MLFLFLKVSNLPDQIPRAPVPLIRCRGSPRLAGWLESPGPGGPLSYLFIYAVLVTSPARRFEVVGDARRGNEVSGVTHDLLPPSPRRPAGHRERHEVLRAAGHVDALACGAGRLLHRARPERKAGHPGAHCPTNKPTIDRAAHACRHSPLPRCRPPGSRRPRASCHGSCCAASASRLRCSPRPRVTLTPSSLQLRRI